MVTPAQNDLYTIFIMSILTLQVLQGNNEVEETNTSERFVYYIPLQKTTVVKLTCHMLFSYFYKLQLYSLFL